MAIFFIAKKKKERKEIQAHHDIANCNANDRQEGKEMFHAELKNLHPYHYQAFEAY